MKTYLENSGSITDSDINEGNITDVAFGHNNWAVAEVRVG